VTKVLLLDIDTSSGEFRVSAPGMAESDPGPEDLLLKSPALALAGSVMGARGTIPTVIGTVDGGDFQQLVERIKRKFEEGPPEYRREATLLIQSLQDYPSAGNHFLFNTYRSYGGKMTWKDFRQSVAIFRGEEIQIDERKKEEQSRNERRKQELQERAEGRQRAEEARRKKKEEMGTIRREDLRRGQFVFVRVRFADQMKLKRARVLDVMRAAVNVMVEGDGEPRTVRFNEIEIDETSTDKVPGTVTTVATPSGSNPGPRAPHHGQPLTAVPQAFQQLGDGRGVQPARPVVEVRRPALPAPPPPPENPADKMNAWIEQGRSMRDGLVKQKEVLQNEMDTLAAEALRIEEALNGKRAEMTKVDAMITVIDQMKTAAA
jgi:hypothetical protein